MTIYLCLTMPLSQIPYLLRYSKLHLSDNYIVLYFTSKYICLTVTLFLEFYLQVHQVRYPMHLVLYRLRYVITFGISQSLPFKLIIFTGSRHKREEMCLRVHLLLDFLLIVRRYLEKAEPDPKPVELKLLGQSRKKICNKHFCSQFGECQDKEKLISTSISIVLLFYNSFKWQYMAVAGARVRAKIWTKVEPEPKINTH